MEHNTDALNSTQLARRRLLKASVYVPPAILGVMLAAPKFAEAAVVTCTSTKGKTTTTVQIVISAFTTACCPCVTGSPMSNACQTAKCLLGNCSSCYNSTTYSGTATSTGPGTCDEYKQSPCGLVDACVCQNTPSGVKCA